MEHDKCGTPDCCGECKIIQKKLLFLLKDLVKIDTKDGSYSERVKE